MSHDDEIVIWDHLEELAQRLRRIVFVIVLATMIFSALPSDFAKAISLDFDGYTPLISTLINFIQDSMLPEGVTLIAFNWLDMFSIYVLMSVIVGFIVTLPYTAYHVFQFISPALYANERRTVYTFVAVATVLFVVGVAYAWIILLPTTFTMLYRFVYNSRIMPMYSVADFFNIFAVGLMGSGLFYTFPLVIWLLVKVDLIDVDTLKSNRRQLFVGLIIITAILTPDPTPFTMFLMSVPFYILYEITIQVLSRLQYTRKDDVIERGLAASKNIVGTLSEAEKRDAPPINSVELNESQR
jgi:sec-independent protein translocase protein TatC